jgi:hypothetical protein
MENINPTPIIGVFRDHAKADHAVEALKHAGFGEDQIQSAVVNLQTATEEQAPENIRIIVTVKADGKDKEAFGILFNSGANNADLPPGLSLRDGKIASSQSETTDLIAEETLEASFPDDSFFGEVKEPGSSDQLGVMDNPHY